MSNLWITRRDFVRSPEASLSGGSWALPLTNLRHHDPFVVAEATDNDPGSAMFTCDLGVHRRVDLFHLQNLRLTVNATLRFRAGLDPTFATTAFDTGLIAAWPVDSDPMSYGPWGEFTLTGAYAGDEYARLLMPRYFPLPSPALVRYIRFEANDMTAADPLRIGVFGACEAWRPPRNFSYGRSVAVMDDSERVRVSGASTIIQRRRVWQRHSFGINFLPHDETWRRAFGLTLLKGQSEPLIVIPDPDDTRNIEKQAIYGLLSDAPAFTNPHFGLWSMAFQVDQL